MMTMASGFPLLMLLAPAAAQAQPWAGILDPARAIDWSKAGVRGGIPQRTTICSTLSPGASVSQINTAIANCPSGQVVYLNAGTYNLSGGIDFAGKSGVTLRGAGADQTHLVFSGSISCLGQAASICMRSGGYLSFNSPQNSATWTANFAKGTTVITLSGTANLSVGSLIVLDQLNDTSDNGKVYICSTAPQCSNAGPAGGGVSGKREQLEFVTVTAISGNNVTISPPVSMPNWRSSQQPRATWTTSKPASGMGLEDMDISLKSATGRSGIMMAWVTDSWVKGVRSTYGPRNHVWFWEGAHNTVRDSHFYESQGHATEAYGVEHIQGSHNLVENNIFRRVTGPMKSNGAGTGNVWSYNYSSDDVYTPSANWMMPSSSFHATGTGYVLHEGNQGSGLIADDVHGPSFFVTAFRNQWDGWETGKSAQTVPIHIYTLDRYFNIIGNVLGRSGYHKKYTSSPGSGSDCYYSIYAIGFGGNCYDGGGQFPLNDPITLSSLMRWGNYDVVSAGARFVSSEVPTGIGLYSNPVPASQTLPPSFYLTSRPGWWGSMPWPAIGPDVTGGDVAGYSGRAWRNPARVCYDNATKDSGGGITNFNAKKCYGTAQSVPLAAPQNLRVTP